MILAELLQSSMHKTSLFLAVLWFHRVCNPIQSAFHYYSYSLGKSFH